MYSRVHAVSIHVPALSRQSEKFLLEQSRKFLLTL
jgi:hypothetical protein